MVAAKREETEALEARYGSVDIEDAIDCESVPLTLGSLKVGVREGSRGSIGEAFGDVMKAAEWAVTEKEEFRLVALQL